MTNHVLPAPLFSATNLIKCWAPPNEPLADCDWIHSSFCAESAILSCSSNQHLAGATGGQWTPGWFPGALRWDVLSAKRSLQQQRFQHSLNMNSFHAWRLILISGICHARARLMDCNVIDVIHWWAQRVWRMSPVEPAGASAITAHLLGVHKLASAEWTSQPRDADGEVILDTNGTVIGSRPSSDCAIQLITWGIESLFRT